MAGTFGPARREEFCSRIGLRGHRMRRTRALLPCTAIPRVERATFSMLADFRWVPGVGVGDYKWGWSLFWGDKNVLELHSGDGPTTL